MSTRPQHPAYEDDERFADWVDDRMSARDRERFEAELRVNPQLREAAERYRRTVESVRTALRAPGPRIDVADAVLARIGAQGATAAPAPNVHTLRIRPLLFSVAAAAAVVVMLALLNGLEPATGRTQLADAPAGPPAGAAAPAHDPNATQQGNELAAARAGGAAAGSADPDAASDRSTLQQALREPGESGAGDEGDARTGTEATNERGATWSAKQAERLVRQEQFGQAPGAPAGRESEPPPPSPTSAAEGAPKRGARGGAKEEAKTTAPAAPQPAPEPQQERRADGPADRVPPGEQTLAKSGEEPAPTDVTLRGAQAAGDAPPPAEPAATAMLPLVILAPRADGRAHVATPPATPGRAGGAPVGPRGPTTAGPTTPGPTTPGATTPGAGASTTPGTRGSPSPVPSGPATPAGRLDKDRIRGNGAPPADASPAPSGSLATLLVERGDAGAGADAGADAERSGRKQDAAVELRRIAVEPAAVQALGAGAERLLHGTAWLVEGDEPALTAFLKELAEATRRDGFTLGHGEVAAEVVQALLPAKPVPATGADEFFLGATRTGNARDERLPQRRRVVVLLRAAPEPAAGTEAPSQPKPRDTGR